MQGTEGAEGEWSVLWKEAVRKGGEKVAYTSGGVTKTSLKSKNIFVQETLNVKDTSVDMFEMWNRFHKKYPWL